jgi:enoyl-[acyl-carrier protein] reductase II
LSNLISDKFFQKGRDFLGVKYPILCGAMTWVSDPKLVATVSNSGGFGCLAGGNTPPEILEAQILETIKLTDKPFGINLVTVAPLYKEHLKLVEKLKPEFVIFAGSIPRINEVQQAKDIGAKVICFASTLSLARRMLKYGADALILEGMEAGGHVGHVSLMVLLQQLLFEINDVPIFAAGGVATGRMCAHLLMMGAAGVQLGTRFAVAEESCAHKEFKQAYLRANARDAISTPEFDSRLHVVAVRALKNRAMEDFGRLQLGLLKEIEAEKIKREEAQLEVEKFWMGGLRKAVVEGDVATGSMMAGQSVGLVNKVQPVREIIEELAGEIEDELVRVKGELC